MAIYLRESLQSPRWLIPKVAQPQRRAKAARERRQLREGNEADDEGGDDDDDVGLLEGKLKREQLKKDLFVYLDGEQ
jgi:hypothetical protein